MNAKNKLRLSFVLAAILSAQFVSAQTNQFTAKDRADLDQLGKLEWASRLIGLKINATQDADVGKVKDLIVDLRHGRVVEVIVSLNSPVGGSEPYAAIPPEQFIFNSGENRVEFKADKAKFIAAPSFDLPHWQANVYRNNIEGVYQYFDSKPYFAGNDADNRDDNGFGEVFRASQVIGVPVRNAQDEKVGEVKDLILSLPTGRLAEVVVASGRHLGMSEEYSPVPPQSFRPAREKDALNLEITKEALANAPRYKSLDWPSVNYPENVARLSDARDRALNPSTLPSQGTSSADVETTRQIRQQIRAVPGLSKEAHNIKVTTLNGQTTLSGPVKNDEEKRQIGVLAAKAVYPSHVDNQLEVEAGPTTSIVK